LSAPVRRCSDALVRWCGGALRRGGSLRRRV